MLLVQQRKSEESGGDHLYIGKSLPNWALAGFKSVLFSNDYNLWDQGMMNLITRSSFGGSESAV